MFCAFDFHELFCTFFNQMNLAFLLIQKVWILIIQITYQYKTASYNQGNLSSFLAIMKDFANLTAFLVAWIVRVVPLVCSLLIKIDLLIRLFSSGLVYSVFLTATSLSHGQFWATDTYSTRRSPGASSWGWVTMADRAP